MRNRVCLLEVVPEDGSGRLADTVQMGKPEYNDRLFHIYKQKYKMGNQNQPHNCILIIVFSVYKRIALSSAALITYCTHM